MTFYAVFLIRPDGEQTIAFVPDGNGGRALYEMERDAEHCARRLRRLIEQQRKRVRVQIKRTRIQEITYAPENAN